jgi:hypothetical protein
MNAHLDDVRLTSAVAGLELEPAAAEHLAACESCQQDVQAMHSLLEQRRSALRAAEPSWDGQRRAILARLPAPRRPLHQRLGLWWRPLLATAAAVALAATLLLVRAPATGPAAPPDIPVEQILAEVDATLDGSGIPGFGPLGSLVPGAESTDELEDLLINGAS